MTRADDYFNALARRTGPPKPTGNGRHAMTTIHVHGHTVTHRDGRGWECSCGSSRALCSHIDQAMREQQA